MSLRQSNITFTVQSNKSTTPVRHKDSSSRNTSPISSSSNFVNYEKMSCRNRGQIYQQWDSQQVLSKWETKKVEPHKQVERVIVETGKQLDPPSSNRSISRNTSSRKRDFVSQIQTLPGSNQNRQLLEKSLTPEPKKVHPLNIIIQQSYLQQQQHAKEDHENSRNLSQTSISLTNKSSQMNKINLSNISSVSSINKRQASPISTTPSRSECSIQQVKLQTKDTPDISRDNSYNLFTKHLQQQEQQKKSSQTSPISKNSSTQIQNGSRSPLNSRNSQYEKLYNEQFLSNYKGEYTTKTSARDIQEQEQTIKKKQQEIINFKLIKSNQVILQEAQNKQFAVKKSPNIKSQALIGKSAGEGASSHVPGHFGAYTSREEYQSSKPEKSERKEQVLRLNSSNNNISISQKENVSSSPISSHNLGIYKSYEKREQISLQTPKRQHPMKDQLYRTSFNFLNQAN